MAARYYRNAISMGDVRDAALYFDGFVPIAYQLSSLEAFGINIPDNIIEPPLTPPEISAQMLSFLPERLNTNGFRKSFEEAQSSFYKLYVRIQQSWPNNLETAESRQYVETWENFVSRYNLQNLPVVPPTPDWVDESDDAADPMVSIAMLKLVDTRRVSWAHLSEFRRDAEARAQLRDLRLFAYENFAGKPRSFVEDALHSRVDAHQRAVAKWAFDTKVGMVNSFFSSRVVGGAAGGSFVAALAGEPLTALAAIAGGVCIELGKIAVSVCSRRRALRELVRTNPVSFMTYAEERLAAKPAHS